MERVRYRRALEVLLGVAAAGSSGSLPRVWFDALAEFESQIDGLSHETNAQRAEARALRKRR